MLDALLRDGTIRCDGTYNQYCGVLGAIVFQIIRIHTGACRRTHGRFSYRGRRHRDGPSFVETSERRGFRENRGGMEAQAQVGFDGAQKGVHPHHLYYGCCFSLRFCDSGLLSDAQSHVSGREPAI